MIAGTRSKSNAARGPLRRNKWLLLRRCSQLAILSLFLAGPVAGLWLVKGSLASSLTLDALPLTDPFVLLQSLLAGHWPEATAVTGAAITLTFYLLVGGRVYCSWVCPVNIVTDAAAWLRRKFRLPGSGFSPPRATRYWILGLSLMLALLTQTIIWELVNPVTLLFRSLLFGLGYAVTVIPAIFLFDLLLSYRGWCGHLCPVGAFYSLPGRISLLRIAAVRREQCNDCLACFRVCPEPQAINPALEGAEGDSPLILSGHCTNCARCIDICKRGVFAFTTRFSTNTKALTHMEATS